MGRATFVKIVTMHLSSNNKWRFGVGPTYTMNSFFTTDKNSKHIRVDHKDTLGLVLKLEYRDTLYGALGIRGEYIGLKRSNGKVDRADNIGFYLRQYF